MSDAQLPCPDAMATASLEQMTLMIELAMHAILQFEFTLNLSSITCKKKVKVVAGLPDDLWRSGYRLNEDMRPNFISRPMASTILRAGKSINFLR